jgi:hypothetical protein
MNADSDPVIASEARQSPHVIPDPRSGRGQALIGNPDHSTAEAAEARGGWKDEGKPNHR